MNNNLQITIRGLDSNTKSALAKKAAQKGLSLNKYAVTMLQQAAGTDASEERYKRMKAFIAKHRIPADEIKRINEAIAWSDKASLEKQRRDERDLSI